MKQPIVNIDRTWTRIVWFVRRATRRPIVANDRAHPTVRRTRSGPGG